MSINNTQMILLFLGMMVVTYLPRLLPVTILSRFTLPPFILECLEYLPVAILGALLFPTLLIQADQVTISFQNLTLIAGMLTTLVAIITKKLHWTVLAGILAMFFLNKYF